jgi:hypothetical protein
MNAASIFKKLRLDTTKKILVLNAPPDYKNILENVQHDKDFKKSNKNSYDFIQVFATTYEELQQLVVSVANAGKYDCLFWICYPKGSGKVKSDIKRDKVWDAFTLINLRPVTQIAIDETWSAMRGRPHEAVGK